MTKITDLAAAGSFDPSDLIEVVQQVSTTPTNKKATLSQLGIPARLALSADQTIGTVSTAGQLFDVTGMSWTMDANTTYHFRGTFWHTVAANTTGFRYIFIGPGVALATIYVETVLAGGTGWTLGVQEHANTSMTTAPATPALFASSRSATVPNLVRITGYVANGATAGTFKMQAASELANTPITLKKGSWIEWTAVS